MYINSVTLGGYASRPVSNKKVLTPSPVEQPVFAGEKKTKKILPAIFMATMISSLFSNVAKVADAGFITPSGSEQSIANEHDLRNLRNFYNNVADVVPVIPSQKEFQNALKEAQKNYFLATQLLAESVNSHLEKFANNLDLVQIINSDTTDPAKKADFEKKQVSLEKLKEKFMLQVNEHLPKLKKELIDKAGISADAMQGWESDKTLTFDQIRRISEYTVQVFQARLNRTQMMNMMLETRQSIPYNLQEILWDAEANEQALGNNQAEAEDALLQFIIKHSPAAGQTFTDEKKQPLPNKEFKAQPTEETRKALHSAEKELAATTLEVSQMHDYYLQILAEKSDQLVAQDPENLEHFGMIKNNFLKYVDQINQAKQILEKTGISPDSLRNEDPGKGITLKTKELIEQYTKSVGLAGQSFMQIINMATGRDRYPLPSDVEATLFDSNAASFLLSMVQGQAVQNLRDAKIANGDMTPDGIELYKASKIKGPKLIW